ncbi:MAG: hypothetical protein JXR91_03450 [Deltaproteobacteria bacterium]|nr:hypothetical protein [Deltaproteobacteria bacterium]
MFFCKQIFIHINSFFKMQIFLMSLLGLTTACANDIEPMDNLPDSLLGECTTTAQCKTIYGSIATDCWNGGGGLCLCGDMECSEMLDDDNDTDTGADPVDDMNVLFATPLNNERVETDISYVKVNAADSDGISNVKLYINGVFIRQENVAPYEWSSSKDSKLANLNSGTYTLKAVAADKLGNVKDASIFVIAGDEIDSDVDDPEVSFATPLNNDEVDTNISYVKVNASDSDGISNVKLYINGVFIRQENVTPYEWSSSKDSRLANLNNGTYTLKAVAADTLGNTTEKSIVVIVNSASAPSGWRIAYSSDGNQHDPDDWHASPMGLALIYRAGEMNRLVHFDYNNHLGDNSSTMEAKNIYHVTTAVDTFGYDSSVFFNCQDNVNAAVNDLVAVINESSESSPLFLVCAGPMEVCWRGLNGADSSKRQYVTVVSLSSWNDNHEDTSELNHTWDDIKNDFNVLAHHINDQNPPAFKSDCSTWTWLKTINSYGNTLYDLTCGDSAAAGDASDAGMIYYILNKDGNISGTTGTSSPTMTDVKNFFGI